MTAKGEPSHIAICMQQSRGHSCLNNSQINAHHTFDMTSNRFLQQKHVFAPFIYAMPAHQDGAR